MGSRRYTAFYLLTLAAPAGAQLKTTLSEGVLLGPPTSLPLPSGRVLTLSGVGVLRADEEKGFSVRVARIGGGLLYSKRTKLLAEIELGEPQVRVTRLQGTLALSEKTALTAGQLALPFGLALSQPPALWPAPDRPLAFREGGPGPLASQEFERGLLLSGPGWQMGMVNGSGRSAETDRRRDGIFRLTRRAAQVQLGASAYRGSKTLTGADLRWEGSRGPFAQAEWLESRGVRGGYVQGGWRFASEGEHPWSLLLQLDRFQARRTLGLGGWYNLEPGLRARLFVENERGGPTRTRADLSFAL